MRFLTWGLSGTLATERDADLGFATERLWSWIDAIDAACNRFRADSEVSRLNARAGERVAVSGTLWRALVAARRSSEMTGGLCDATVLPALVALGYDRDYDEIARAEVPPSAPVPAAGMAAVALDESARTATLAPGVGLDLGASAKALLADLVAADVAARGGGVVVEVGGDVAVRGRGPDGPWAVGVSDTLEITGREPRVSVEGGLATSSLAVRTWRAAGRVANHIVDPRTGLCADGPYATATVSAADCVTANAFATAALLWGEDAAFHVAQAGWSARLVRRGGEVEYVGGWPADQAGA
jgi:FAD:protein FMN transferase